MSLGDVFLKPKLILPF